MRFNFSLIESLSIELPLYSVNHEARGIALEYINKQKLVQSGTQAVFLRSFNTTTDTVFLPADRIRDFLAESVERMMEPDLFDRIMIFTAQALPRLAVTRAGFEAFKGVLRIYFEDVGYVGVLCVVDVAPTSTHMQLEDVPGLDQCGMVRGGNGF
jgi:hypothetical protein